MYDPFFYYGPMGFNFLIPLLTIVGVFLLIKVVFKSKLKDFHSRWNTLIDEFNYSSQEFYRLLELELGSHNLKGLSIRRVYLRQGSLFSARRLYLKVRWKDLEYLICAAPFGKGFFISWWLLHQTSLFVIIISKVPFIGARIANSLQKKNLLSNGFSIYADELCTIVGTQSSRRHLHAKRNTLTYRFRKKTNPQRCI